MDIERNCESCEFYNSVCMGYGKRTDNGKDTYGMPIEEAITMFPNGCGDWGISLGAWESVEHGSKITMTVDNIWFDNILELSEVGKQGIKIIWKRDGKHSTDDLQIILEFEKLGFDYKIYNYEGEFEKKAIKIEFTYKK